MGPVRYVPDYAVERVPRPVRKDILHTLVALALAVGFMVLVGALAFRPLPPPAPATAPVAGGTPVTAPSAR